MFPATNSCSVNVLRFQFINHEKTNQNLNTFGVDGLEVAKFIRRIGGYIAVASIADAGFTC
jgi:hypothetical protein